jgi:hypothetical protein
MRCYRGCKSSRTLDNCSESFNVWWMSARGARRAKGQITAANRQALPIFDGINIDWRISNDQLIVNRSSEFEWYITMSEVPDWATPAKIRLV